MATTMERRHFEVIAQVLKDLRENTFIDEATMDMIAQHFASRLFGTNPNFKVQKFLNACGMK